MTVMSKQQQAKFEGNWSFSWLMKYESCPMHFKLGKIDKLPEKPRPPDNPLERGNRIHKNFEDFVLGKTDVLTKEPKQIEKFRTHLEHLRFLKQVGMATAEEDWLFDQDWEFTLKPWNYPERKDIKPIWLWAKLDASVYDPAQSLAISVDYKSGKSTYKAYEHVQQLQLYAAISALKFPDADFHSAELWYVDEEDNGKPHFRVSRYTREEALSFIGRFQARADKIYADRYFRPNPTAKTCIYCPYGPRNGTGACPVGV